jgi:hypothetical protein
MKNWVTYLLLPQLGFVVFLQSSAWPQTVADVQQVTAKNKAIVIQERGNDHAYDFHADLNLHGIKRANLLFQNRANGQLYLLVDVLGPSTAGGNIYCGAGQEEYLIWLALDSKWEQSDRKVELITSCFATIESSADDQSYEIKDGKLISQYINYRDKVIATLIYDSAKPNKAWTIQRQPIPGSAP